MKSNSNIQAPYLRVQRNFPLDDGQALAVEINKSYVDIASAVNFRTVGVFTSSAPVVNGESWFITSQRQQGVRQVYPISGTGSIAHGIDLTQIYAFTRIYGTFTDGSNWYPLPYVSTVAGSSQVNIVVTSTNIVISAGGGSPPSITSGYVILEWISNV